MKLRTLAVLIGIGFSSQHTQAGVFLSGNTLYGYINGSNPYDQNDALGFISGIADAETTLDKQRFCMPDQVSRGQAKDIVTNYLSAHPELRHYSAAYLAVTSFIAAFPCRK